ncbi:MAG TPA: ABC transporter substrate-binding protein [Saprospiraceae bacterium]|nr:ABC transporter substrate-binding protein [Saprospiraceae bacterium]
MHRLKTTAVSYLNTKPFLYGLFQSGLDQMLDISLDIPSECARKLSAGEADFGLIPVVAISEVENPVIISDYCIGADGPVRTVMIYSDVPIDRIQKLYLDFHSRTSVRLAEILLREYWQVSPELIPAKEGYLTDIQGDTAGIVIGDRAFALAEKYTYQYDLGEYWKKMTGLPFVFAAWVSRSPLPQKFIDDFNAALKKGLEMIPQLIALMPSPTIDFDLERYFKNQIQYELDAPKREALALFLEKVNNNQELVLSFQ